jgi:hypothetical protein
MLWLVIAIQKFIEFILQNERVVFAFLAKMPHKQQDEENCVDLDLNC